MSSWSFVLPGQPPSWNDSYHIVRKYRFSKGGARIPFHTLAKKQKVIDYQTDARLIIRSARPSRWEPEGQVRIWYWLRLSRDIDCDNIMKAIHDVIEEVTGVDDKRYLPMVSVKETGCKKKDAGVFVIVEDPASPLPEAAYWNIIQTLSSPLWKDSPLTPPSF